MRRVPRAGSVGRLLLASTTAAACAIGVPHAGRAQSPAEQDRPEAVDLWKRNALMGDWNGARTRLDERGLAFSFNYTGEVLGNIRGGERRLAIYEGRLEMSLDLDLEKALG